jgi:mannose-6-phosphate isomerase
VFVLELQEPTDFSILLEWKGFAMDGGRDGHVGLGFDVALGCVDRSAWSGARLRELSARRADADAPGGVEVLFPPAADPFFRAERSARGGRIKFDAGYSVVTALAGSGTLTTQSGGDVTMRRGDLVLLPHGAGAAAISGPLQVIRCRPPDPAVA